MIKACFRKGAGGSQVKQVSASQKKDLIQAEWLFFTKQVNKPTFEKAFPPLSSCKKQNTVTTLSTAPANLIVRYYHHSQCHGDMPLALGIVGGNVIAFKFRTCGNEVRQLRGSSSLPCVRRPCRRRGPAYP